MNARADLLDALAATLDNLAVCVIIVADRNRIVYANRAGAQMLGDRGPLRSINGCLSTRDAIANEQLAQALALARRKEREVGAAGIGVALGGRCGEPAIAQVIPLAQGEAVTQVAPESTAAVFVVRAAERPTIDFTAVAEALGLTPSETRLVEKLMAGATLPEAAVALCIADTTAKTHLTHIFSKAGVARQVELIALIHRLAPPVRNELRRHADRSSGTMPNLDRYVASQR